MAAVLLLTLRQSAMSIMWATLVLCCLGVLVAVVCGVLFRRYPFWWAIVALVSLVLTLSVAIAFLDELGFGHIR